MMKLLSAVSACITLLLTVSSCGHQNTASSQTERESNIPVTSLSANVQSLEKSSEYQFTIQDVRSLQDFLLARPTEEDLTGKPYDINGDNRWDVFDLCLMKQELLKNTDTTTDSDTLVVYFSRTGNTEKIAEYLIEIADADSYVIEAAVPYTDDDADTIREKMLHADVLVFATPIYYYEMSGILKTMLDRANPLYSSDYLFREIYALATAAEDEEHVPEKAFSGIEGWVDCFERAKLAGTLFCGGVNDAGEISGNEKLRQAYDMGKNI